MSKYFESLRSEPPTRAAFDSWREGKVIDDLPSTDEAIAKRQREEWNRALLAAVPWRAADRVASDDFDPDWPAVRLTRKWLSDPNAPAHIMLRGPARSGKTIASTLVVQHWLEPGARRGSVLLLHPNALISAMLYDYDPSAPKVGRDVRLVVVDDLGRESKPGLTEALCQLLDRRNLRVVMSTNLGKLDFAKVYDDPRLLERLRETTFAADVKPGGIRYVPGDF